MSSGSVELATAKLKIYKNSKVVARNFFLKKTVKNTTIIGLILLVYLYSKADGFIKAYPTAAAREKLVQSLGSNVGIEALLGVAHKINTMGGYVVWNFLVLVTAVGAVWAIIFASKVFRGEEESGRTELFLGGQTTSARLAANILKAFGGGLIVLYILVSLTVVILGHLPGADFSGSSSLFFSLCMCLGTAEFLAIGALTSQIMPTRSRALGLSVMVFAVFYLIRLAADVSSAHWLLVLSPLGWIEKLSPMYASDSIWLLPIGLFIAVVIGLTLFMASKRDLGEAVFNDKDSAKSHMRLLNLPLGLSFRLNRAVSFAWLAGFAVVAFVYSLLAKGAVQSFSKSNAITKDLNKLAAANERHFTALGFMGVVFLIVMVVGMLYSANAVGRIRDDEAKGYLDNFLVKPISRVRWLVGRIVLGLSVIVIGIVVVGIFAWIGQAVEHTGISLSSIATASVNALVPAVFILGAGILIFGFLPRLTSSVAYIVLGWSFLLTTLASGININHWLLDTSIIHQVSLAPAVSINWTIDLMLVLIAVAMALVGLLAFNRRDIKGE